MHMIGGGISTFLEVVATRPRFQRIVTPTLKFSGDNADAIYYDADVSPDHTVPRARPQWTAPFTCRSPSSATTRDGGMASRTAGVINDEKFDVDGEGRFEIRLGGPKQERNWLGLEEHATRITTRHYYENEVSAAADPARNAELRIEVVSPKTPPPPAPSDASIARSIRRVARFVRSRTLEQLPMAKREQPSFVGLVPNQFPKPVSPDTFGLAAFDALYSMAPYYIGPDEALVMTGRWPRCRCANVSLWNRFLQTLDYANRPVSRNRAQTTLAADGSFEMVLAHRDPGHPNWIDTEGKAFGLVFWRSFWRKGRWRRRRRGSCRLRRFRGAEAD